MLDFGEMLKTAATRGKEVMAREPTSAEEAILHLLITAMNLWDQNIEPIASKFDKVAEFLSSKDDPLYGGKSMMMRVGISQIIHQMRKARRKSLEQQAQNTPAVLIPDPPPTHPSGT